MRGHQGFIVRCSQSGKVSEIVLDDYNMLTLDSSMISMVDRSSSGKFFSFLKEASNLGGTIGWEINFTNNGRISAYFLAGIKVKDDLIITGSTENSSMRKIYNDVMRINNEQTNTLRSLQKSAAELEGETEVAITPMDGLTKINNEMANLHRELSKKNIELAAANKKLEELNAEKNRFLGMAAHDLRNPLTVVQHHASELYDESEPRSEDEKREMLNDIKKSSFLMLSMVNDFLDINKIESGKLHIEKSDTDVLEVLKDSISANQNAANAKNINLKFNGEIDSFHTNADKFKLMQVFNNYISNAVKYSHPDTETEINVEIVKDQLRIEIVDQGQGIPEAELAKLFKPYGLTSVKPTKNEKSTGLGLSIVANIIEAHGGTYGATSVVGEGSTFWLTIPIEKDDKAPEMQKEEIDYKNISLEGIRVLIVDDDLMLQKLNEHALKSAGPEILVADNGKIASDMVAAGEKLDIILMDLEMPVMNGLDATSLIRKSFTKEELPIVILSAAGDEDNQRLMIEAGANILDKTTQEGAVNSGSS